MAIKTREVKVLVCDRCGDEETLDDETVYAELKVVGGLIVGDIQEMVLCEYCTNKLNAWYNRSKESACRVEVGDKVRLYDCPDGARIRIVRDDLCGEFMYQEGIDAWVMLDNEEVQRRYSIQTEARILELPER